MNKEERKALLDDIKSATTLSELKDVTDKIDRNYKDGNLTDMMWIGAIWLIACAKGEIKV